MGLAKELNSRPIVPRRGLRESCGNCLSRVESRRTSPRRCSRTRLPIAHSCKSLKKGKSARRFAFWRTASCRNHFHLVVWPARDGQIVEFMQWFQMMHSKRWHRYPSDRGHRCAVPGRFKAFPVQDNNHFLNVCRYVERNPLRGGLVTSAEEWPWSSLGQRCKNSDGPPLETWPIPPPSNWTAIVNCRRDAMASWRRFDRRSFTARHSAQPAWAEGLRTRGLACAASRGVHAGGRPLRGEARPTQPDLRFA